MHTPVSHLSLHNSGNARFEEWNIQTLSRSQTVHHVRGPAYSGHWGTTRIISSHVSQRCLTIQFRIPLQWRHNERDGVSNHRRVDSLPNRVFERRSKKTSKLRVTGLCEGNSLNSSHKGAVTRKCFHLMTSSCRAVLINSSLYLYILANHIW